MSKKEKTFREQYSIAKYGVAQYSILLLLYVIAYTDIFIRGKIYNSDHILAIASITTWFIFLIVYLYKMRKAKRYIIFDDFLNN